jgi:hypothetical protein
MIIKCKLIISFSILIFSLLFFLNRLCLANSERIKYTPYMHMVFEVQDLASASPATVSRYVLKILSFSS